MLCPAGSVSSRQMSPRCQLGARRAGHGCSDVSCPERSLVPSTPRDFLSCLHLGFQEGTVATVPGLQALPKLAEWPCLVLEPEPDPWGCSPITHHGKMDGQHSWPPDFKAASGSRSPVGDSRAS